MPGLANEVERTLGYGGQHDGSVSATPSISVTVT
jgi:hypothetical protein